MCTEGRKWISKTEWWLKLKIKIFANHMKKKDNVKWKYPAIKHCFVLLMLSCCCEYILQCLKHLDRNSIFAHLNSRMSLLDYGRQRSKVKAALSLTSFLLAWRLVHMRVSMELFEMAPYWNRKRYNLYKLCQRQNMCTALEKPKLSHELHICCHFAWVTQEARLVGLVWWHWLVLVQAARTWFTYILCCPC